jgi:hypothetical protein
MGGYQCIKEGESAGKDDKCCIDLTMYNSKCVSVKKCQIKGEKMTTQCCGNLVKNKKKYCDTQFCIREGKSIKEDKQKCCGNLTIITGKCTSVGLSLSANKKQQQSDDD